MSEAARVMTRIYTPKHAKMPKNTLTTFLIRIRRTLAGRIIGPGVDSGTSLPISALLYRDQDVSKLAQWGICLSYI